MCLLCCVCCCLPLRVCFAVSFFFFNAPATTEIYTLSLHDALPISAAGGVFITKVKLRSLYTVMTTGIGNPFSIFWVITDRKSTRLNSSHLGISYAVFCLKKKKKKNIYYNISQINSST